MKWQSIAADVRLGRDVKSFDFVNLYGCEIGDETRIGTFVEIRRGAKIGRRVKIQSHTFICEGVEIEDDVFVGHRSVPPRTIVAGNPARQLRQLEER
jgi:UDP-2-acetamido-3-amino-2,3-dideoxy-glucuronate N-acetyltransferase